jgi:amino acid transporter
VALIFLRIREPELKRPFRVPGGLLGAIAVGIPPVLLLGFAILRSEHEVVLGMSSLVFGLLVIGAGVVAYLINRTLKPAGWTATQPKPELAR